MKVRCIDNISRITGVELNFLKKGKVYNVIDEMGDKYIIIDEDGERIKCDKNRFEIVEEDYKEYIKIGDRVKLIKSIGGYVKVGTLGIVIDIIDDEDILFVEWDEGLKDKKWYSKRNEVELVKNDIVMSKEGITIKDIIGHSSENGLYENECFYIQIDDDLIQITNKINDNTIAINMNDKFKFKKEYNFNEAFERSMQLAIPLALDDGLELLIDNLKIN